MILFLKISQNKTQESRLLKILTVHPIGESKTEKEVNADGHINPYLEGKAM